MAVISYNFVLQGPRCYGYKGSKLIKHSGAVLVEVGCMI
jgi:hypothetical protein